MSGRTVHELAPDVLAWARKRADLTPEELAAKMRVKAEDVFAWERDGRISHSRIHRLADATYAPWASLYSRSPPKAESLPLQDFRTPDAGTPSTPSVHLRDTVDLMLNRVDWMREYLIEEGVAPIRFVGSGSVDDPPGDLADILRTALSLSSDWATEHSSYQTALSALRDRAEEAGILVVFNGVVGNNASRQLDRREFQGFAIADAFAPLVFVNNADFKGAQMFTFAHELAHLALGADALSRYDLDGVAAHEVEQCCNRVAAEFLVPGASLRERWRPDADPPAEVRRIARQFNVSGVVAARRALDADLIQRTEFRAIYAAESARWTAAPSGGSGGNFWVLQKWRIGRRFAAAVTRAVRTGQLSYSYAFMLTGLGKSFFNLEETLR